MPYSMFRNASAAIPLGMSAGAFITVLIHILSIGTGPAADEGTAGHTARSAACVTKGPEVSSGPFVRPGGRVLPGGVVTRRP